MVKEAQSLGRQVSPPAIRVRVDPDVAKTRKSTAGRALKRSLNPGFAGIENELFYDPKVSIVLGDAKHTLTKLLSTVKTTA